MTLIGNNRYLNVYLNEVPIYEMFVPETGRPYFVMGISSHDAKDRLDVFMREVHERTEYSAVIRYTYCASEALDKYHARYDDTIDLNNNQECWE